MLIQIWKPLNPKSPTLVYKKGVCDLQADQGTAREILYRGAAK